MPIIAAIVGAAALATQPTPIVETVRSTEGLQIVRLSYTELASVTSPVPAQPHLLGPPALDLRLSGKDYAWESGIRTIALSSGVGSNSQAITTLYVQAGTPD
jgi:hypothetical protein